MTAQKLITLGENETIVFKSCKEGIHTNVFETICAFLNTAGGTLLLGVDEKGSVCGFKERAVPEIVKALEHAVNCEDNFQPPIQLKAVPEMVDGKSIIRLEVPESANVHAFRGRLFLRKGMENHRLETKEERTRLYVRKQETYTERKIYPYLREGDLEEELLERAKACMLMQTSEHPFGQLEHTRLLKAMNLWGMDYESGERGLRFAAALLFGKDSTLQNLFANTEVLCEKWENGQMQRMRLETNIMDEAEKIKYFLQSVLGEENAALFAAVFLISREYTSACPAKIMASEHQAKATFAVSMGRFGNPMLQKWFQEMGFLKESELEVVQKKEKAGVCELTLQLKMKQQTLPFAEIKENSRKTIEKKEVRSTSENSNAERFTPKERQNAIVMMMEEDEQVNISAMVARLQVTKRTILRDIDKMKKEGLVRREGSEKNGRWIITKSTEE